MKFELVQEFPEFENVSSMTVSPSEEYIFVSGRRDEEFTGGMLWWNGSQYVSQEFEMSRGDGNSRFPVFSIDEEWFALQSSDGCLLFYKKQNDRFVLACELPREIPPLSEEDVGFTPLFSPTGEYFVRSSTMITWPDENSNEPEVGFRVELYQRTGDQYAPLYMPPLDVDPSLEQDGGAGPFIMAAFFSDEDLRVNTGKLVSTGMPPLGAAVTDCAEHQYKLEDGSVTLVSQNENGALLGSFNTPGVWSGINEAMELILWDTRGGEVKEVLRVELMSMSEDGVAIVMPMDVTVTDAGIITLMMEATVDMETEEMSAEAYTLTYDGEEMHKTSIVTWDDEPTIMPYLSSDGMFVLFHDDYYEEPPVLYVLDDGVWVSRNIEDVPRGRVDNFLTGGKITRVDRGAAMIFDLVPNLPHTYDYGEGTPEDPYQIHHANDFKGIREYLNSHFIFMSDINLSTWSGRTQSSFSVGGNFFGGSIDGQGFTLTLGSGRGLFENASNFVTIKDLNIVGGAVLEDPALFENLSHGGHFENISYTGYAKRGGLINVVSGGGLQLVNCSVDGDIEDGSGIVSEINTEEDVALLGCSWDGYQLQQGYNSPPPTGPYGGIAGNITTTGSVEIADCSVRAVRILDNSGCGIAGNITAGGNITFSGCLVANQDDPENGLRLTGNGLAGTIDTSQDLFVEGCDVTLTIEDESVGVGFGLFAEVVAQNVTITDCEIKATGSRSGIADIIAATGSLTIRHVTLDAEELVQAGFAQTMSADGSLQIEDCEITIQRSGWRTRDGGIAETITGEGAPVISRCHIKGSLGGPAIAENILHPEAIIQDCTFEGNCIAWGGFVVRYEGDLLRCRLDGIVQMGDVSDGDKTTAGLIGENHNQNALMEQCVVRGGIAGPNPAGLAGLWAGNIDQCFVEANVYSNYSNTVTQELYATGLVGTLEESGSLKNSGFIGNITAASGRALCGLVLEMKGIAENCFAQAIIEQDNPVGAISGLFDAVSNSDNIESCYFAGQIIGGETTHGLVHSYGVIGENEPSCYFATNEGVVDEWAVPASEEELKLPSTLIGWDFDIWEIDPEYNRGLALLRCLKPYMRKDHILNGTGTKEDPYEIWTNDDFASLGEYGYGEGNIALMADLDFEGWTDRKTIAFIPKRVTTTLQGLQGDFDGRGHTIRNITGPSLFLGTNGKIENLVLENINIVGTGALIDNVDVRGSAIEFSDIRATGTVSGDGGGLVRQTTEATVTFNDCHFEGSLDHSGGILWRAYRGQVTMDGCTFEGGAIRGSGGVVRYLDGNTVDYLNGFRTHYVRQCSSDGTFDYSGGIAFETYSCITYFEDCVSKGTFSNQSAGIMVSQVHARTNFTRCKVEGIFSNSDGFCRLSGASYKDCHVKGSFKTEGETYQAGGWGFVRMRPDGLVLRTYPNFEDCTFEGTMHQLVAKTTGAIAGEAGDIIRCLARMNIVMGHEAENPGSTEIRFNGLADRARLIEESAFVGTLISNQPLVNCYGLSANVTEGVTNCFVRANLTSPDKAIGFVGNLEGDLANSYFAGMLIAPETKMVDVYPASFDFEKPVTAHFIGEANDLWVSKKAEGEMNAEGLPYWDFDSTWDSEGELPILRWMEGMDLSALPVEVPDEPKPKPKIPRALSTNGPDPGVYVIQVAK